MDEIISKSPFDMISSLFCLLITLQVLPKLILHVINTQCGLQLLVREWPNVLALLAGLIAIKTAIITAIGPRAGLTLSESVRTGLLLSQGGEFAFVVLSLANRYATFLDVL